MIAGECCSQMGYFYKGSFQRYSGKSSQLYIDVIIDQLADISIDPFTSNT